MTCELIDIATGDGSCPTRIYSPSGQGSWPAIIIYMDGLAIRPTLFDMAQRLADHGYLVLLPDMFYRAGPYPPIDVPKLFASGDVRGGLSRFFASTDTKRAMQDSTAFLAYLDTRKDVLGNKIGVVGYCMGGGFALTAAGTFPERVAVVGSFHGGNLATDDPQSPHLLAHKIKARVYVAGADKDESYPPEMAARLEQALTAAGVDHTCEIYAGAYHGWTMTDAPIYNEAAAERHWTELFKLMDGVLKG